jgi:hypothetical protein
MKTRSERGSLLIVAMIFSIIIAVALTSYLKMATNALNLSNRTFLENEAMNLTEAGIEQALYAFNQSTGGNATAWTSPYNWVVSGNNVHYTFSGFNYSQNATGVVKVFIQNYNSSGNPAPIVVSQGIITPASGPTIVKTVQVQLVRRSLFGNGLVGRNGITFSGNNASVDSWNSNPTNAASGTYTPVAYSGGVQHDLGSIAAINVTATVSVQNADIWGYASVGGNTSQITVGPQGLVGPFGTPSGTKDPSHVSGNFTDNLPNATNPTPSYVNTISTINSTTTLPQTNGSGVITDTPASDGKYYDSSPGVTLTNKILTASHNADVVLILTAGSGTTAVSVGGGSGSIVVNSGSSLSIYTAGNVSIAGNGVANNASQAIDFQIWGTNTTAGAQSIGIVGNGVLSAVVYAPNAAISAKGGGNSGSIYGAFVGYTVNMTGNDSFHYDESLANFGGNNPFTIVSWTELRSAADRATQSSNLNF